MAAAYGMPAAYILGMTEITHLLSRMLDGAALRQEALASNIANAHTPDYQRRDVAFVEELKSALNSNQPAAVSGWQPSVSVDRSGAPVSLEREFAAMNENQLLYTTSADILARKYAGLRKAIKGT